MDEIRKQLASLMETVDTDNTTAGALMDPKLCRYFLCGLCPHDLFQNTKQYLGPCPNNHSKQLQEKYKEHRKRVNCGFEQSTYDYIKKLIDECDRRIQRHTERGRCDTQDEASESIEASAQKHIDRLEAQIKQKLEQAETSGNTGDIDGCMKIMEEVQELQKQKKMIQDEKNSKVEETRGMWFQKLKPCDVCGALLSERESDAARLKDHYTGRIHLGFQKMRAHLDELQSYIQYIAPLLPKANQRFSNIEPRVSEAKHHRLSSNQYSRRRDQVSKSSSPKSYTSASSSVNKTKSSKVKPTKQASPPPSSISRKHRQHHYQNPSSPYVEKKSSRHRESKSVSPKPDRARHQNHIRSDPRLKRPSPSRHARQASPNRSSLHRRHYSPGSKRHKRRSYSPYIQDSSQRSSRRCSPSLRRRDRSISQTRTSRRHRSPRRHSSRYGLAPDKKRPPSQTISPRHHSHSSARDSNKYRKHKTPSSPNEPPVVSSIHEEPIHETEEGEIIELSSA